MDGAFASWLAIAALVLGAWMGGKAFNESWKDDCQAIGMHREQGVVYKCERVK